MIDWVAFEKARRAPDHAEPPARMSGGDRPVWDADMSYWCDDMVILPTDEMYGSTFVEWDRSRLTVLANPRFISPHKLMPLYGDQGADTLEVKGLAISGTIGG